MSNNLAQFRERFSPDVWCYRPLSPRLVWRPAIVGRSMIEPYAAVSLRLVASRMSPKSEAPGTLRIANIVSYIQSLQVK